MKYLIIGNGAAGTAAAEKLRRLDAGGEITILTAEGPLAYSKCLLSDSLFENYHNENLCFKEQDFYHRNHIQVQPNQKVSEIDFNTKIVKTLSKDGQTAFSYPYEKLLIASGSKPIVPKIKGLNQIEAYYLNTMADAQRIRDAMKKACRVLIVGAGFIGLETAFNLRKNGLTVTVVEKESRILPRQLDEKAAHLINQGLEVEGIRVICDSVISAVKKRNLVQRLFDNNDSLYQAVLENGNTIETDMLILATGSRPNLDFLKPGQLKTNKGILVDAHLMTSVQDVYAAGDVVESVDVITGEQTLSPIWPNAVIQGEYAAFNMAGYEKKMDQLLRMQNAAEFREIPLISMGNVDMTETNVEEFIDYRPKQGVYRKILIQDERIIGMLFLGEIRQAGVIGALMKSRTPVQHIKNNFFNPNFGYHELKG